MTDRQPLLKSKLFWVGILYFAQGLPFGIFFDVLPVYFRQHGVDLREIGLLALLGLAWTIKFLWAPVVDHYRRHRRWMFAADVAMGGCLVFLAVQAGFGPPVWWAIGLFTLLSATNDIAIDGYTIEMLDRKELGLANGIRIAAYRVGLQVSGLILVASDILQWSGAFVVVAALLATLGIICLFAPKEGAYGLRRPLALSAEINGIARNPRAAGLVLLFLIGALWLVNNVTHWSVDVPGFWAYALGSTGLLFALSVLADARRARAKTKARNRLTEGPMFGALMEMLQRPLILPIIAFILLFKLGDASMGFMVKPFWVDAGFTATQIGLVSVNVGVLLSILGGIAGGWYTDRVGIFKGLWVLGLTQALSNLGYVWAAAVILPAGGTPGVEHQVLLYTASAVESFTGGLGTAAFLAFLMAIVDKKHAATEYAILSSVFALSRQLAGYASGFGASELGYAPYFLLTFFLAFPAYLLLPWVRTMLADVARR